MIQQIGRWWRGRQRNRDIAQLWPTCKGAMHDIDGARRLFRMFVTADDAWRRDYSQAELEARVRRLS